MAICSLNAYAAIQVGNIDDLDGTLTTIKRGTATIPAAIYTPLEAGDLIHVSKNHSINIRQCGTIHTVTHQDSPYAMQSEPCKVIGLVDNILLNIKELFDYVTTIKHTPSIEASTKSDKQPLTMPMLVRTSRTIPSIQAGERALALRWFGGKATSTVQITDGKEVLWQAEVTGRIVRTAKLNFQVQQTYWFIITGTTKPLLEREFRVVAKLPTNPKLQDKQVAENMRNISQAVYLVEQNDLKWSFEAYQQIVDISDKHWLVGELRDLLPR